MRKRTEIAVVHPSTQGSYEAAIAARSIATSTFVTGFYAGPRWARVESRGPMGRLLARRAHAELPRSQVRQFPVQTVAMWALRPVLRVVSSRSPVDIEARAFDWRASRWIRAVRPRLVHAFEGGSQRTLEAARDVGARTILDARSAYEFLAKAYELEGEPRHGWEADDVRMERRLADLILVPSDYAAGCLVANGVDPVRVRTLPYGVDTVRFRPEARTDPRTLRVLYVGRLSLPKGLRYLLDAWRLLCPGNTELWLAGLPSPAGAELLRSLPPTVRVLGKIPHADLPLYYRQADVFVMPSLSDAWPFVVAEAMASGLPSVVTDACGGPVRDGLDGLVVAARDATALAESLETLLRDPQLRERMGSSARQLVEADFTWEHYRRRLGELYRGLLFTGSREVT